MLNYTLYVVDDEATARSGMTMALQKDYDVKGFEDAEKALANAAEADRDFLEGKMLAMKYFFEYELPRIEGLRTRLMSEEAVTTAAQARHFTD